MRLIGKKCNKIITKIDFVNQIKYFPNYFRFLELNEVSLKKMLLSNYKNTLTTYFTIFQINRSVTYSQMYKLPVSTFLTISLPIIVRLLRFLVKVRPQHIYFR